MSRRSVSICCVLCAGLLAPGSAQAAASGSPVKRISPAQKAAFGVFKRARVPADAIPRRWRTFGPLGARFGANFALSRRARTTPDGRRWLVPGRGFVCLVSEHAGGALPPTAAAGCQPLGRATAGQLFATLSGPPMPANQAMITGAVPTGVGEVTLRTSSGPVTAAVEGNVYDATVAGLSAVSFRLPGGRTKTIRITLPTT